MTCGHPDVINVKFHVNLNKSLVAGKTSHSSSTKMYTNPPKQKLQDTTSLSFRNLKRQILAKPEFSDHKKYEEIAQILAGVNFNCHSN